MRKFLIISAVVVVAGIAVWAACGYLWFATAIRMAEQRFEADKERAAAVLAADPAFRRLEPFNFPSLGYSLGGPVEAQADYDRLRAEMARIFGEDRVAHILADVWVEQAVGPKAARDQRKE